ncbi:MAG: flagellar biosynthetic protein FliO [Gammaproteobacteria bacterium]|nr:flagellar biosynthetic protein FliO [Gammaproteobacteria bacterium]MDE2264176.1 flagellar biosynthetic protein FliO [Gammaproteobacteria bacterium]
MSHLFAAPHAAGPIVAAAPGPGQAAGGVVSVTLALALVLAAIFAFAWLARRVRGFGNRSGDALDVIAEMPLGPKERAVLLKVGTEQILVGVAPGRLSALHVLREPVEIPKASTAAAPGAMSFAALLKRSLGK